MLASSSNLLRLQRAITKSTTRTYHDLITLPSGKPVLSQGVPGYSAVSGHTVTVFGSSGFLGRYVVSKLGKLGTQVVAAYRDEDESRLLKPMGDLGQIVRMEWDLRREDQILECLRHSDTVYNLVGRNYETKNFKYDDVHVVGAERLARIAKEAGVQKFIHVSHLNASHESPSAFLRSKAAGEERVLEAFPTATIIRPSTLFGYEDRLLTNMAMWPAVWNVNHARTTIRPVHVMDVAEALANLMSLPALPGATLNLPGPSRLSHQYLLDLIESVTMRQPSHSLVLPKFLAKFVAEVYNRAVWWPTISADEIERRYIDDSDVPGDWDLVNVIPAEIENHAITYLRRFRYYANYTRPVVFPPREQPVEY